MTKYFLLGLLSVVLYSSPGSNVQAAELTEEFIAQELQRAQTEPDSEVNFTVAAPAEEVFDFLINRLADYSEDVSETSFDHSSSQLPGQLGVGSDRIVNPNDGKMLVHRFLSVERPGMFAYLTDMERSTADVPIDYSLVYYEITATGDEQSNLRVAAVYRSSSSLLSMFVRRAFNSALETEFGKATEILGSQ